MVELFVERKSETKKYNDFTNWTDHTVPSKNAIITNNTTITDNTSSFTQDAVFNTPFSGNIIAEVDIEKTDELSESFVSVHIRNHSLLEAYKRIVVSTFDGFKFIEESFTGDYDYGAGNSGVAVIDNGDIFTISINHFFSYDIQVLLAPAASSNGVTLSNATTGSAVFKEVRIQ
jgi:hypothetical protein